MNSLISIFKEVVYLGATASILILTILLTKKIFHKALSPKWHYYIWILLLVRLLVPVFPESSISIYNLFSAEADKVNLPISQVSNPSTEGTLTENFTDTKEALSQEALNVSGENTANPLVSSSIADRVLKAKESPKYNSAIIIMAFTWITGVLLLSVYSICINIVFAVSVRKRYTLLKDERINTILEDCKSSMRIKHPIPLLTSNKVRTPALYGFFNTKILISEIHMEKLSAAEIKYIFLHELSHYKRKDIAVNWILALLQIVYFFNPLIWYAFYKIHEDCEISCDASALGYINECEYQSYGSTVIKLIKLFSESNFIPVTAGISKNKSSYKRRIIMISKFKKSKWTNTLLALVLIVFVGSIGLTGCKVTEDKGSNNNTALTTPPSNTVNNVIPDKTAVQQETNNQVNTNTDKQPTPNTNTNTNTTKQVQNTAASTNQAKEAFYGQWVIKQVLAYGPSGTYSTEDAKGLVGKSLSFSADKATCFGDDPSAITKVASKPVYKKAVIINSDFTANYRMTFDKLGIKGDSIKEITVSDSKGAVCTFLIKDDNTLILVGGGTYFELVRKTA
jgi:bla regulator protein BlaR1